MNPTPTADAKSENGDPLPVRVDRLSVAYNQSVALRDASFTVNTGDYVAVVGPNGSGKTTLIKALLGLVDFKGGDVQLFGVPIKRFNDWRRVGYMPQVVHMDKAGFPATVGEIVASGRLSRKRFPKRLNAVDWRRVDEVLTELSMDALKGRSIDALSGGQRQRAFLARAMVNQPDLLILDEPAASLDPDGREQFHQNLKRLNQTSNTTIILVTHDSSSVGRHAGKLLYLNRSVVFNGSFDEFCHSDSMSEYFGAYSQHLICGQHDPPSNQDAEA